MEMKVLILSAVLALALAEPPVDNRYLPPQQGFGGGFGGGQGSPSQNYGPPGASGFGGPRQTDAVFGNRRPSPNYGPPSASNRQPSNQYIPPQRTPPSSQYGAPFGSQPSSQYGAPSNQFGVGSSQSGQSSLSAPSQEYGAPSNQYAAPSFGQSRGRQSFGTPSNEYGAPSNNFGGGQYSQNSGAQSKQYLPPGGGRGDGGYGGSDEGNGEPANYNFEYMVKDDASGNDFGHRESRQGDRTEGLYYVVLPDGRKQTVQYEADQNGYRPKISYEDVGFAGGYNRNAQGYQSDSQSGPY